MRFHLLRTLGQLYRGQSLARIFMNEGFSHHTISGQVVDIGGGRNPDYFKYFKKQGAVSITPLDGAISGINFEHDPLPIKTGQVQTVLMCNLLEHLYDPELVLSEAHRVLKKGGMLIGFVPFWIGYHPDPEDYVRYTKPALKHKLETAGFSHINIENVGGGPLIANFNTIVLSLPRFLRPICYLWYTLWNSIFLWLRPLSRERTPLGYIFTAENHA